MCVVLYRARMGILRRRELGQELSMREYLLDARDTYGYLEARDGHSKYVA